MTPSGPILAGIRRVTALLWGPFMRLLGLYLLVTTSVAYGDVTIEERTSVEGAGMMRMANMNGASVTTISGDRARIETNLQMQSRMVRMLARGLGPSADIIRLDQDKSYRLDLKKKQYTEESLAERRAQLQAAMEQSSKAQPSAPGVDESQCEWSNPKADVARTGEKANIAGSDAERIKITATQSCRDRKTGSVCEFGLLLDQWVAPNFTAGEESRKFYTAYAQKMGFDAGLSKEGAQRAEAMFSRYKGIWTQVAAKMKDVKGYPVKSSFALAVGGPQCQGSSQQSADTASPADAGGIAGRIAGSLFNRKKDAQQNQTAAAPAMVAGMAPLLTVTSELISLKQDAAGPGTFDVPADFKKVARSE